MKALALPLMILLAGCTAGFRHEESLEMWPATTQPRDGLTAEIIPGSAPGRLNGPVPVVMRLHNDTDHDLEFSLFYLRGYGLGLLPTDRRASTAGHVPGNLTGQITRPHSIPADGTLSFPLDASDAIRFKTPGRHTLRYLIAIIWAPGQLREGVTSVSIHHETTYHGGTVTVMVQ